MSNARTVFADTFHVPRETMERLDLYVELLKKWQAKINLVSASTLHEVWQRHMLDSAQLVELANRDKKRVWVDLGSGAGFPGLVVAILAGHDMHLVESDARKCAFMQEVARQTQTKITIHNCRIEAVSPFPADIISARALAPLTKLLDLAQPFFGPDTIGLFLKGQDVDSELTETTKYWNIDVKLMPSRSDSQAKIVYIRSPRHV